MAKLLLINPSYKHTHTNAMPRLCLPFFPVLGLATVAARPRQLGHDVRVLDYCYEDFDLHAIMETVKSWKPDVVGLTGTTPLFPQICAIAQSVKRYSRSIVTIGGGAHCSALPQQSVVQAQLDYVCYGEGDFTLAELVDGKSPGDVGGVVWSNQGQPVTFPARAWIGDLDALPYPSWELFDLNRYARYIPPFARRRSPTGFLETSRGCTFSCNYCASKNTAGRILRKKSVRRVIEEIRHMQAAGFQELFIVDDIFTADAARVKEICEGLLSAGINLPWSCASGLRVDTGDQEMFTLMKKAGCYKVAFGIESGDTEVLQANGRGGRASAQAAHNAAVMCQQAGIDTQGFFMVGLLHDTEAAMTKTIELGRTLPVNVLKVSICVPFPGTSMYTDLQARGLIYDFDWKKYNVYNPKAMYQHPTLSWDTIERYHKLAYRRMVLWNPRFYASRFLKGIFKGDLFYNIYYFVRFLFSGARI
jgi:radical SAM superfamily enzyme YgiQ (UPF0313 family)